MRSGKMSEYRVIYYIYTYTQKETTKKIKKKKTEVFTILSKIAIFNKISQDKQRENCASYSETGQSIRGGPDVGFSIIRLLKALITMFKELKGIIFKELKNDGMT